MNDFDGQDTGAIIKQMLNSRCPHGYSKRKNCSKCQSKARQAANTEPARPKRRSVYETRNADHA